MQYNREMERSVRNTETDHVAVESGQGTGPKLRTLSLRQTPLAWAGLGLPPRAVLGPTLTLVNGLRLLTLFLLGG